MLKDPEEVQSREIELLSIQSARARREEIARTEGPPIDTFTVGQKVLVAKAKALGALKMPPFESKWFGPCEIVTANHPLYGLRLETGKRTRKPIHARRLKLWVPRMDPVVALAYEDGCYYCNSLQ